MNSEKLDSILKFSEKYADRLDASHMLSGSKDLRTSARDVKKHWRQWVRDVESGDCPELLNCYIHIPFCEKKCTYCIFHFLTPSGPGEIDEYLDFLIENIEFFSGALRSVRIRNLWMGGGSPSILTAAQLERLLGALHGNFGFFGHGQKAFEFNPASVTAEKIAILRKYGFNRINTGVQSFSKKTLEYSGRGYQTGEMVERAVGLIRDGGFTRGQNIDLLLGLKGDTPASFVKSFGKAIALKPDMITVYKLHPAQPYLDLYFSGDAALFKRESLRLSRETAGPVADLAAASKYTHGPLSLEFDSWNFKAPWMDTRMRELTEVSGEEKYNFYSDLPVWPFSVLGLGSGARSHIFGKLSYMTSEAMPPCFDSDTPVFAAKKLDTEFEMARFVLLSLDRETTCMNEDFESIFKCGIEQKFGPALRTLENLGIIKIGDGRVNLVSNSNKDIITCGLVLLSRT